MDAVSFLPDADQRLSWHPKPVPIPADAVMFDEHGRKVSLRDACAGRLAIVNLWATWCAPCILELPELLQLQNTLAPLGARVLTVSLDRDTAKLGAFVERRRLQRLRVYRDPDQALFRYVGARALPTSLVVDPAGREVARVTGPVRWMSTSLIRRFRQLSARPPATT